MLYLVGSRFFGTHREDSDWDYLGADTLENRELCEMANLQKIPTTLDNVTRYSGVYEGRVLDVCLVKDIARSLYMRNTAALVPEIRSMSKIERHLKLLEIANGLE